MRNKRRRMAGIGVLVMVGLGVWLRELASWRPVLVGHNIYPPNEMRVSRDGKWLWTRAAMGLRKTHTVEPLASQGLSQPLSAAGKNFNAEHGRETFPRLWVDESVFKICFVRARGAREIELNAYPNGYNEGGGWSLARNEIYTENQCMISIWSMDDGQLKRRVRYANGFGATNSVFSPDGKWLLATQANGKQIFNYLRRFDVQSGKLMATPKVRVDVGPMQFSPDGTHLLIYGGRGRGRATVFSTSNWKELWAVDLAFGVGWSPDNRVGLIKHTRFEWRDAASGDILQVVPGPSNDKKSNGIWAASPQNDWIYAAEQDGTIRRWCAR